LEVALFNRFNQVGWHARDLMTRSGGLDSCSRAKQEHLRAMILVRIVLDLVRGRDAAALEKELRRLDEEKPSTSVATEPNP
jgi:hypothetical protein